MPNKNYRLTYIFKSHTKDNSTFVTNIYGIAYDNAIEAMKTNEYILGILIYSNEGTYIVINRNHLNKIKENGTVTTNHASVMA